MKKIVMLLLACSLLTGCAKDDSPLTPERVERLATFEDELQHFREYSAICEQDLDIIAQEGVFIADLEKHLSVMNVAIDALDMIYEDAVSEPLTQCFAKEGFSTAEEKYILYTEYTGSTCKVLLRLAFEAKDEAFSLTACSRRIINIEGDADTSSTVEQGMPGSEMLGPTGSTEEEFRPGIVVGGQQPDYTFSEGTTSTQEPFGNNSNSEEESFETSETQGIDTSEPLETSENMDITSDIESNSSMNILEPADILEFEITER